jgi:hypothetical protein
MVGISVSYRPVDGIKLYGEFLLEEYGKRDIGKAHWANKWAWQLRTHLVDIGLPRTDMRVEFARMRPFLYSHSETINSYTHFGDVMGHPAGPNAWNLFIESSWIASRKMTLTVVADITHQGVNTDETFGSDPNVSYDSRACEIGNDFLQGNLVKASAVAGLMSYEASRIYSSTFRPHSFLPCRKLDQQSPIYCPGSSFVGEALLRISLDE